MGRFTVRRARRQAPGKFRLYKPQWVDPFPQIPGTHPEKVLFAALYQRGIYFIFQGSIPITDHYIASLLQAPGFQPDFMVPEWKIIYDPFGDFAHSQPDAIGTKAKPGRDVWKQVYYESQGWEFIHPWSSAIERNGGDWMIDLSKRIHQPPMFKLSKLDQQMKERQGYRLGPSLGAGAQSVAIANHMRAKPKHLTLKVGRR